ncbi:Protein RIK [Astathelohania contejeani]|uniref:Protein RIK n=1 Tax=Astathelohania contejeani TaxID=164912 RepID=A0ABQ7HY83_9MICR|nr:Protein RIK [Thelohania contejeani]
MKNKWDLESPNKTDKSSQINFFEKEKIKNIKCSLEKEIIPIEEVSLIPNNRLTDKLNLQKKKKNKVHNYKFIKLINIDKCKYPYFLSRNKTLMELDEMYGAEIVVSGKYKPLSEEPNPNPLILEISAPTEKILNTTIEKIKLVMDKGEEELNNLFDIRKGYNGDKAKFHVKIPIGIYDSDKDFDLVNIIKEEIESLKLNDGSVIINLRGRFSGYIEPCLNDESNDPCYLHIIGSNIRKIKQLKNYFQRYFIKIKEDYEDFKRIKEDNS